VKNIIKAIIEPKASIPTAAPTPAFAPVDNPVLDVLETALGEGVGVVSVGERYDGVCAEDGVEV